MIATLEQRGKRWWVIRTESDHVCSTHSSKASAQEFCKRRGIVLVATHEVGATKLIKPWDYVKAEKTDKPKQETNMKEQTQNQTVSTTATPATPAAHHRFSPSKLKYLVACPGYEGSDEPSDAAIEGTMLHAAAETGETDGLTDEQARLVKMCRDYGRMIEGDCQSVHRELPLKFLPNRQSPYGVPFGTADVVAVNASCDHAHVVDYKFGRVGVEPAETNLQGWAYALGVFDLTQCNSLTVHFLMPRRDEVSSAVFERDADYKRMELTVATVLDVVEAWEAAGKPAASLRPDPATCRWCARAGDCPALGQPIVALMERESSGLVFPAEMNPCRMTLEQLGQAQQVKNIVRDWPVRWIKMLDTETIRRMKAGEAVPNCAVKRKAGDRECHDTLQLNVMLATEYGFDAADMKSVMKPLLGEIEKIIAKKAGRGKGTKAVEQFADRLEDAGLVTRKPDTEYVALLD